MKIAKIIIVTITTAIVSATAVASIKSSGIISKIESEKTNLIETTVKKELNDYQSKNIAPIFGSEELYFEIKRNHAILKSNNCVKNDLRAVCFEHNIKKEELKEAYDNEEREVFIKIKAFYTEKLNEDGKFKDFKDSAITYLTNKSLNENVHYKANAIVFSN